MTGRTARDGIKLIVAHAAQCGWRIPSRRQPNQRTGNRTGHVLPLVVIALAAVFGVLGLVFDAGLLMDEARDLQHLADAAATAGAMELLLEKSDSQARNTATDYVHVKNGASDVSVQVNIPPTSGAFAGADNYLEVVVEKQATSRFMHLVGGSSNYSMSARAVAGFKPSTDGAAIVVLDQDPPSLSIPPLPALPTSFPALVGGLEVLGLGTVVVEGSVLVNTNWGGEDENGDPAGVNNGPPWGIACTPVLPLTKLRAQDIRVQGGVDKRTNYGHLDSGEDNPLRANRLPVPDPLRELPAPTVSSDPVNVQANNYGHRNVINPLSLVLGLPIQLQPGVYDSINIDGSYVVFQPGVYVIRGKNPVTQIGLSIVASRIVATDVMFYVTNSSAYDVAAGWPDQGDEETNPQFGGLANLLPSVLIVSGDILWSSSYSPITDPTSPYNGLMIYQRRHDPRPVIVLDAGLLSPVSFGGTIYAKWGHVLFGGRGAYNARIVAGTARLLAVLDMTLSPLELLPPAHDVYLVE